MRFILICCMALTGALVSPALAHTGVGQPNSFACGIAHPQIGKVALRAMGGLVVVGGVAVIVG